MHQPVSASASGTRTESGGGGIVSCARGVRVASGETDDMMTELWRRPLDGGAGVLRNDMIDGPEPERIWKDWLRCVDSG